MIDAFVEKVIKSLNYPLKDQPDSGSMKTHSLIRDLLTKTGFRKTLKYSIFKKDLRYLNSK